MGDETRVVLGVGGYPDTPIADLPDWYLAHLMADATEPKWGKMTVEQQEAVAAERNRRAAAVPAVVDSPSPSPEPVPEPQPVGFDTFTVTGATVSEAEEVIAGLSADELDAVEAAEQAGADRKGVQAAIDKRREELE